MVRFLYGTPVGRWLLKGLTNPIFSRVGGYLLDHPASRIFIKAYIGHNHIDMNRFEQKKYYSFNDFFVRKLKAEEPFPSSAPENLLAPCDGKVSVYRIGRDQGFRIKNSVYSITDLLADPELGEEYQGGTCVIFRLTPDDYHRFSYFDNGVIRSQKKIKGILHTVRPIAHSRYPVFIQNSRVCTVMDTEHFGTVVQVEVGALMVGKINHNQSSGSFRRGEENGFFEFGGSTIILLLKKNTVKLHSKLKSNIRQGLESKIAIGEMIGRAAKEVTYGNDGRRHSDADYDDIISD